MSETRRYDGPVRPGMRFTWSGIDMIVRDVRNTEVLWTDESGSDRGSTDIGFLRKSASMRPVRPADDDAIAWARFLPEGPLADTGRKAFKVGQVYAATFNGSSRVVFEVTGTRPNGSIAGKVLARKEWWIDSINLADVHQSTTVLLFDVQEANANGPISAKAASTQVAPVKREPVAPWVRSGGGQNCTTGFSWTTRRWEDESHSMGSVALYSRPAPNGGPGNEAACEACAEAAGVFGSAARTASKPTRVEAKAAITPLCPACNDTPFETKRCPRCGLASKAEPVRVRLAPFGACVGPLAVHGVAVLRVIGLARGRGKELAFCDGCYTHVEREIAAGHLARDMERVASVEPPARIGTVPQVFSLGVGVWAARGMRG